MPKLKEEESRALTTLVLMHYPEGPFAPADRGLDLSLLPRGTVFEVPVRVGDQVLGFVHVMGGPDGGHMQLRGPKGGGRWTLHFWKEKKNG